MDGNLESIPGAVLTVMEVSKYKPDAAPPHIVDELIVELERKHLPPGKRSLRLFTTSTQRLNPLQFSAN